MIRQRLRVDENECHAAQSAASIGPGVVRSALDENVACVHQRLALIQDRVDLTLEHDRVINGVGLVKALPPSPALSADLCAAPLHLFGRTLRTTFGCDVDDAKYGPASVGGWDGPDDAVGHRVVIAGV